MVDSVCISTESWFAFSLSLIICRELRTFVMRNSALFKLKAKAPAKDKPVEARSDLRTYFVKAGEAQAQRPRPRKTESNNNSLFSQAGDCEKSYVAELHTKRWCAATCCIWRGTIGIGMPDSHAQWWPPGSPHCPIRTQTDKTLIQLESDGDSEHWAGS